MGKYDYLIGSKTSTTTPQAAGKYSYLVKSRATTTPTVKPAEKPPRKGILGGLQTLYRDVRDVIRAPFPKQSFNPVRAFDVAADTVAETLTDTFERYKLSYKAYQDPKVSVREKVVKQAELSMGLVNTALSPITASLTGAAHLPVVGSVAESINRFFGVLGTVGSDVGEGAVEALPVSDKTKALITPLAQEVGALVAQIAAGKASLDKVKAVREKSKTIAEHIDKDIIEQGIVAPEARVTLEITPKPIETAATAKPIAQEFQIVKKEGMSTLGHPTGKEVYRVTQGDAAAEFATRAEAEQFIVKRKAEVPSGEGVQVANTRAQTLEKAAVEKKLTTSLGELPTHERMSMADQASRAVDFIERSPDQALKVIRGEAVPDGILPEALYTAMEIKAIKNGDVAMLKELANSPIPTTVGQAMKALDSADPYSPVRIMRDLQQFREAKAEKKSGKKRQQAVKDTVLEIKEEVQKSVSKRPSWEEFLKEIQCK